MILLLLALVLVGGITLSVLRLIDAETGGGIRELQATQVFNVAQAGIHYAIGKLQLTGASTYAGENIEVKSGETTLGMARVIVNCPDTGTTPPCAGPYARYRRIISTGTLSVSGPTRTIVAVVEAATATPGAICAYEGGVDIEGATTIHSDVGSNAAITFATSPGVLIRADQMVPQRFKGTAVAMGSITCGSSCATQVQGGILPKQSHTVCPALTPRKYVRGGANLYVGSGGVTMNAGTGYAWNDVRIAPGSCSGPTPFTDLNLQADPSNPNATTVVQINTLVMGNCSRVVILGAGKIELRVAESNHSGILALSNTRFAVLPTDTLTAPVPVPASRFIVWVNSYGLADATTAARFSGAKLIAGTIFALNGRISASDVSNVTGAVWGRAISLDWINTFSSDISGLVAGGVNSYANFSLLRSWKDQ